MKLPEAQRRELRLALLGSGHFPAEHIDEIVDIAVHAAETAIAALQRICFDTSPDPRIGVAALGPALSLLGLMVESGIEGVRSYGAEHGLPVGEVKIGGAA